MHFVKCDGCGKTDILPEDAAELDMKSEHIYYWDGQLCDKCASKVGDFIRALKGVH